MNTILIHAQCPEMSTAWADRLSNYGNPDAASAAFSEIAKLFSARKVDAATRYESDPAIFLAVSNLPNNDEKSLHIIAVTEFKWSHLEMLFSRVQANASHSAKHILQTRRSGRHSSKLFGGSK